MQKTLPINISIIASRAVYSMYWVYLSSAYIYYIAEYSIPKYFVGYISWAFILGAASTQLPAAYIASKWGPDKTYIFGLALLSFSGIISAISPSFLILLGSRIIAGAGAGLFFSTAGYSIFYLNQKKVGFWMGIYNSFFAIGAIIGYLYSFFYTPQNWKSLIIYSSLIGLILSFIDYIVIKRSRVSILIDKKRPDLRKNVKPMLAAVALSGYWGTFYAAETLLPSYYALSSGSVIMGNELTLLLLTFSFIGGFFTYFYDKVSSKRLFLLFTVIAGGLGFLSFYSKFLVYVGLSIIGFFDEMSISSLYALSIQLSGEKYSAMALSLVNFINMILGMWVSIFFSYFMIYYRQFLWLSMFLITVFPSLILIDSYFEPKK